VQPLYRDPKKEINQGEPLDLDGNPDALPRRLLHTSRQIVRWGDMDFYGHVNNTVYFRYFEQARVEWLEQAGFAVSPGSGDRGR
jgi:hypothetical protein